MEVGEKFLIGKISVTQHELHFSVCWTDGKRFHLLGNHTDLKEGIDQELNQTALDNVVREDLERFREIAEGCGFDLDVLASYVPKEDVSSDPQN